MLSELRRHLTRQPALYDQIGAGNPYDLAERQRAQQVRFHLRGYRAPQHQLQQEQHLLNL
jgi:hypothetical protein